MDDRILAMCELSNDLLFQKIPPERMAYYVAGALEAGRAAAGQFRGTDIRTLYQNSGIQIHRGGTGKKGYGVVLRGQATMSPTECSVEVYPDSIDELARHSTWEGRRLTGEEAMDVHLAHEFFHIWEYQQQRSIVEELDPVVSFTFLGLKRRSRINRCGEIAAHAFAKELLSLPCLPNLYDYLYLIDTEKMKRSDFEELCSRMERLLLGQSAQYAVKGGAK